MVSSEYLSLLIFPPTIFIPACASSSWAFWVQFSSVVSDSLWPHESQHARPPCPSPIPGVHSDSRPSSPWCHPAISSSVVPFSSCPQSLTAWEYFPMSQLFAWGGQSTEASALASFLPKNNNGSGVGAERTDYVWVSRGPTPGSSQLLWCCLVSYSHPTLLRYHGL